jgi:SAM-dependent methyltransferase
MDGGSHWDGVYARSTSTEVSWFQSRADYSLRLMAEAKVGPEDPVIDVGAGASVLVDALLEAGHQNITVLDVSASALAVSRDRVGLEDEGRIRWIVADLLRWRPPQRYRVWHDRAVFHFLTLPSDRERYRAVLSRALSPGGYVVIGTFAEDGPTQCSGLPTARYTAGELAAQFPGLRVLTTDRELHHTPAGRVQPFTWLLLADAGESGR